MKRVGHLLPQVGYLSASPLSEKRAAACSVALTTEMFRKVRAMYEALQLQKILKTPAPTNAQIFNLDEVGYDGNGKYGRVLVNKDGKRKFYLVTGEHGPFWVTQVLWSCANGQLFSVPTVIHQAHMLSSYHTKGLPENWVVHASQSGVFLQIILALTPTGVLSLLSGF